MAWEAVWTNQLGALTLAQQTNNANIIYYHFHDQGWEDMPIAAMLGNMHIESQMNPAQWEAGYPIYNPGTSGFGLSQWTPWRKFRDWAGSGWETNYNLQLARLDWEADPANQGNVNPDGQWIPVASYEYYTFMDFAYDTTHSLQWLVECYEYSYERGTPAISQRLYWADYWYQYITGHPPPVPSGGKIPIWLLFKLKERWKR